MQVRSSARINGKTIDVELTEADIQQTLPKGYEWDGLRLTQQFAYLSAQADLLVVQYLEDSEDISTDFANQRRRTIKEKLSVHFR